MKRGLIVTLALFILLLPLVFSDLPTETACTTDLDCQSCEINYANLYDCYCNSQDNICYVNTTSDGPKEKNTPYFPPLGGKENFSPPIEEEFLLGLNEPNLSTTNNIETSLSLIQQQVLSSESKTQQQLNFLEQKISQLTSQVQTTTLQVNQVGSLQQQLNTISTGLAALQDTLDNTNAELGNVESNLKKEQKRTKLLSGIIYTILALAATAALVYYISSKRRKINPHILKYITEHIKAGNKFPHIKSTLVKAGWAAEDIEWAYKYTMKHNYKKYSKTKNKTMPFNKKKVTGISIVSILILISVVFLLKGVTTGQAIQFPNQEAFEKNVLQSLKTNIANNQFYPLIESATLCVEVKDGKKLVSYRIIKTSKGHSIDPAFKPCSEDKNYNAAVKFTSWLSFNHLVNDFNCKNSRELHALTEGTRGVYVLPSQLVLEGFKKNPKVNYLPFCPLLKSCLTNVELNFLGC